MATEPPTEQSQPDDWPMADKAPSDSSLDASTVLWPLSIARILIGCLWLFSLRWKLPPSFDGGSERGLAEWLNLEVEHAAFGFYGDLIEKLVIPNFTFFAWLLFVTELAVGISLLLGLLTRAGAAIGLLMSLNLGIGLLDVPGEWPWSYAMLAMWHGVFVIASPGRIWGLDAKISSRNRRFSKYV